MRFCFLLLLLLHWSINGDVGWQSRGGRVEEGGGGRGERERIGKEVGGGGLKKSGQRSAKRVVEKRQKSRL